MSATFYAICHLESRNRRYDGFLKIPKETPPAFLIIRPLIKPPRELLRIHRIDKSVGIDLPDLLCDRFDLIPPHNGVQHIALLLFVTADPLEESGVMVRVVPDFLIDFVRFGGDNEESLLLVPLV